MADSAVKIEFPQLSSCVHRHAVDYHAGGEHERHTKLAVNMSKADSQYVEDALGIEDEYESELAAVQVALTRYEVTPYEYARRRSEIAARAFLRLAAAHQRFVARNS